MAFSTALRTSEMTASPAGVSRRDRSSRSPTSCCSRALSVSICRVNASACSTSPSSAAVSADCASSRMPAAGVLSSWLALATKSRRTLSRRARSVMSVTATIVRRCAAVAFDGRDHDAQDASGGIGVEIDGHRVVARSVLPNRGLERGREAGLREQCALPAAAGRAEQGVCCAVGELDGVAVEQDDGVGQSVRASRASCVPRPRAPRFAPRPGRAGRRARSRAPACRWGPPAPRR